jgi:hypothetical protein
VAHEAADAGLLGPELAAGIRRVKGVRRLGVQLGNWLTPDQGRRLLTRRTPTTPRALRDHAIGARQLRPLGRRSCREWRRMVLFPVRAVHVVIGSQKGVQPL